MSRVTIRKNGKEDTIYEGVEDWLDGKGAFYMKSGGAEVFVSWAHVDEIIVENERTH